jgi:hypothetical protein
VGTPGDAAVDGLVSCRRAASQAHIVSPEGAKLFKAGTYRARRAAAAGPSAACQRCCWCRLGRASPIARAGAIGGQVRHRVILTARAISVPFRARRHRFAAVSHGNSRPLDLGVLYYRCAAARMVRMGSLDRPVGPHRGDTPPESHGQHRTTAATQHRSSAALLDQYRRSSDHPGSLSHGGSQGFKSPHLHPQPCRSERRQRRAGGAHCGSRPRCGRERKSQSSQEGSQQPGDSALDLPR